MTFNDVMEDIKSTIEDDAALAAFCTAKWGKTITVKRVFRRRTEVALDQLPIVLLTRPATKGLRWTIGEREYEQSVMLYFGFHQPDTDKAQAEQVELEEKIEDALIVQYKDPNHLPAGAEDITPGESVNDEGANHPTYWTVKGIGVDYKRTI